MRDSGESRRSWRPRLLAGLIIALVVSIAWGSYLAQRPRTFACQARPQSEGTPVFFASSVEARPWFGRHHVYAIFVVPRRYRSGRRYRPIATIDLGTEHETLTEGSVEPMDSRPVEAGFF